MTDPIPAPQFDIDKAPARADSARALRGAFDARCAWYEALCAGMQLPPSPAPDIERGTPR